MNYTTDKQVLGDLIDVVFQPGETIKMICQPRIKSFYLNEIRGTLIILLLFLSFFVIVLIIDYLGKHNLDWSEMPSLLVVPSLFIAYAVIKNIHEARKTTYIITDLSIIIYKDLRNPKTIVINRCDIQTRELTKTFIDKYLGTGTIRIFTGEMKDDDGTLEKVYDYISAVTEPEKVFALV